MFNSCGFMQIYYRFVALNLIIIINYERNKQYVEIY